MKRTYVILLFGIYIVLAGSCKNDPLDITPDGRITLKDVFASEEKTEAFLNTVYTYMPDYFTYYQFYAFLADCTDDAEDADVGNETSSSAWNFNSGSMATNYNPLGLNGQGAGIDHYTTYWEGIRKANIFLANIDEAHFIRNPGNKLRYKAEAKLLRAFYYWELIKQFGPMPMIRQPLPLDFNYTTLTRPSFQTDIDSIVKDCNDAIANPELPIRITHEAWRGHFSKAVAYAIKSEALLFNASPLWNPSNDVSKWQAAADAGEEALTALTAGDEYALYPDYGDYFLHESDINNDPKDKETIYEINRGRGGTFSIINSIPSKPGLFKAGSCPTQELVDAYGMQATGEPAISGYSDADHLQPIINTSSGYDPNNPYVGRDPRFYATVWYNGAQYDNIGGTVHTMETYLGGTDGLLRTPPNRHNTHTGYYLRKWIDPALQSGQKSAARWKVFRLAEIYLNYAEAENEVNGADAKVYAAIDKIRGRAQMPDLPAGLEKDAMRDRIHHERRVEMPFEEQRFWDVRRWKTLSKTGKVVTGMQITKEGGSFSYQRFVIEYRDAWQDKYLIFPIPIEEVSKIPGFSQEQNPGW